MPIYEVPYELPQIPLAVFFMKVEAPDSQSARKAVQNFLEFVLMQGNSALIRNNKIQESILVEDTKEGVEIKPCLKGTLNARSLYMADPNTRVFINHNNDAGVWQYSIQVAGTDFWIDSFKTLDIAEKFIALNKLQYAESEE